MPEGRTSQDEWQHQDTRTDTRSDTRADDVVDRHVAGLSRRQQWLLATQDLIGMWPVGEGPSDR